MPKKEFLKGCKVAALSIEIIADQEDQLSVILRSLNGQPIKVLHSTPAIIDSLNEVVNSMLSPDKTAAE